MTVIQNLKIEVCSFSLVDTQYEKSSKWIDLERMAVIGYKIKNEEIISYYSGSGFSGFVAITNAIYSNEETLNIFLADDLLIGVQKIEGVDCDWHELSVSGVSMRCRKNEVRAFLINLLLDISRVSMSFGIDVGEHLHLHLRQ